MYSTYVLSVICVLNHYVCVERLLLALGRCCYYPHKILAVMCANSPAGCRFKREHCIYRRLHMSQTATHKHARNACFVKLGRTQTHSLSGCLCLCSVSFVRGLLLSVPLGGLSVEKAAFLHGGKYVLQICGVLGLASTPECWNHLQGVLTTLFAP